jgi:hypothetical protein
MVSIFTGPPPPTEEPEEPTPTEDPTAEPTDSPSIKLRDFRIQNAANADPNWCCSQNSQSISLSSNLSSSTASNFGAGALTNAGIDPLYCEECCGKAPEDYWWKENEICPKAKCEPLIILKNGVMNENYFFYSNQSKVPVLPLNVVINGKLVPNFPFLKHYSIQEGNGRRSVTLPNGSNVNVYTGGDTLV